MNSTLLNSYSGIKTHQFGIDSISNNIANVNTIGYRESRPEFETLLAPKTANAGGPTSNEINMGVSASSNAISTKSGSYRASGGEFDLAYQGKGWFVVGENKEGEMEVKKDSLVQKQQNFFTRDGSFGQDGEGYLVNSKGYYVYGVNLGKIKNGVFTSSPLEDSKNLASQTLSPIQIPKNLQYQPLQSTKVDLAINLNPSQNPINAYKVFTNQGKLDNDKILDADADIFFCNQKALDPMANKEATIQLVDALGEEKNFTFSYGKSGGANEFKTLRDLQKLIKDKTGLDLSVSIENQNTSNPYLALNLSNPTLAQNKIQTSGSFFDVLGMADSKQRDNEAITPFNPTHTYQPNELVSYHNIVFRKIQTSGSNNPISNPQGWEIVDTQGVKPYQEGKSYQEGDVVKNNGGIYMMDNQNQFLKIGDEATYQIASFDPNQQYGNNTLVRYDNKLYKRIGSTGNSNPQEDPKNWQELSLGNIKSGIIEVPSYTSSTEIYDENGKKYQLVSEFCLIGETNQGEQKWEVTSCIEDFTSKNKIGKEIKHSISFDSDHKPIAKEIEMDFKGKKLIYDLAGTQHKQSSNVSYNPSEISLVEQDGSSAGVLNQISIDDGGIIHLKFSNGKQEAMGRVGIVAFTNDQGLSKMGGNLFGLESMLVDGEQRLKSGNPILGWNEEGKLQMGHIKQGYLETSNVEIGNALTELILMQRGYSMNAKSFTTGDELIKEAINLKR